MSHSLIFLTLITAHSVYVSNPWPAVATFLIYLVDMSVIKPMFKPPDVKALDALKNELDLIKLELNSLKFRAMK